jgi:hypothetical protein
MLAVAAAGLVALFGVLAVPVVFVIDAERAATVKTTWRVRWLYGLVKIESTRRRPPPHSPEHTRADEPTPASRRKRMRGSRMAIAVLRTRGLPVRLGRLALAFGRRVRFEDVALRVSFGFDDPADTGMVYGFLSPWLVMATMRGWNVGCWPMFLETGVTGRLQGTLRVRPLAVLGTVTAFLLSPPVLRAIRSAWRART